MLELLKGFAVVPAPLCAVRKEHVGALRLSQSDSLKVRADIFCRIVHVAGQDRAEFIDPLHSFCRVGSQQGVHGEYVHLIVMAEGGLLADPFPQGPVVNDVVASDEAGEVEGLGRGVECNGVFSGVLADTLDRDMSVTVENDVRPDFIADDLYIVFFKNSESFFKLFPVPDPSTGIVGGAEDCGMNVVAADLVFHVFVVHAPVIPFSDLLFGCGLVVRFPMTVFFRTVFRTVFQIVFCPVFQTVFCAVFQTAFCTAFQTVFCLTACRIFFFGFSGAGLIDQRAVDDVIAVVFQCICKTDIGRAVNEDTVPAGAEDVQGADNAPQDTVLIPDAVFGERHRNNFNLVFYT